MRRERQAGPFAVSLVLHIVLGAGILWVLSIPMPLEQWLNPHRTPVVQESINFFRTAPAGNTPVHSGGNGRTVVGKPPAPKQLVAPVEIPTTLPPTKPGAAQEQGTGPIVSAGGAGPGIMPMLHDPRIWLPPGAVMMPGLSDSARFDSAFHETMAHLQDSAMKHAGALSGVFSAGGKKYGIDSQNIYIADYKIPAALLALIPIHPTYSSGSQEQLMTGRQVAEVNYQTGRALDAEDFHDAVKRIRMRKEREKRQKEIAAGHPPSVVDAPLEAPPPVRKPQVDPIALQTP
jgi:hypothetical protein